MNTQPIWSLGIVIGLPVLALIAVVLLGMAVILQWDYLSSKHTKVPLYKTALRNHEAWKRWYDAVGHDPSATYEMQVASYRLWRGNREADYDTDQIRPSRYDDDFCYEEGQWKGALGFALVALIPLIVIALGFYPYHTEYHQYRVVSGVVQDNIGRRVDISQSDLYSEYAVKVNGQTMVCDDTRCSLLQTGDHVNLRCKPDWHWSGAPTEYCSFVSYSKA